MKISQETLKLVENKSRQAITSLQSGQVLYCWLFNLTCSWWCHWIGFGFVEVVWHTNWVYAIQCQRDIVGSWHNKQHCSSPILMPGTRHWNWQGEPSKFKLGHIHYITSAKRTVNDFVVRRKLCTCIRVCVCETMRWSQHFACTVWRKWKHLQKPHLWLEWKLTLGSFHMLHHHVKPNHCHWH